MKIRSGKCSENFLLKIRKIFGQIGKTLPKCSSGHVEWSFEEYGWKIFAHKVLKCFKEILKNTFPKLLGWTHCRMQFWQPFWKPFAQRPEVFRAQSEKFSQITYFGHVESNFENHNKNFCLKLRKVFKKMYLNNVPSDLKTRSFGNPPNKVTQKAVLTNLSKSFLLGARKMFKKIVTQKWSIAQK